MQFISRVLLAVLACTAVIHVAAQDGTQTNTAPYFTYGDIIPTHVQTLPNYDATNTIHYHYVINNLHAKRAEQLASFTSLFTPINADPSTFSITVHVARPTATAGQVTYVQSVTVTGVQSGVAIDVSSYNIQMQAGDFLVLSVPNNSINLRVGPNNQGDAVPYATISIVAAQEDAGSLDVGMTATVVVASGDTATTSDGFYQQLCSKFVTFGEYDPAALPLLSNIYAFNENSIVTTACHIDQFRVGLGFQSLVGLAPTSATVGLVIARQSHAPDQHWFLDITTLRTFTGVTDNTWVDISGNPIAVQAGDMVGFIAYANAAGGAHGAVGTSATPENTWYYPLFDGLVPIKTRLIKDIFTPTLVPEFEFKMPKLCRGGSDLHGDPQFAGFQGQNFQFHGMADEVFNLISTPKFQLNGNFKYLSAGKCDYNDTECYTHPGTYVDQLGFTIGDIKIKAIAGSHVDGLRVWMNDIEFHPDPNMKAIFSIFNSTEQTGFLKRPSKGKFIVDTPHFTIQATNSDYFFNMEVALKHTAALVAGQKKVSLKQKFLCMSDGQDVASRLAKVEDFMANYYPRFPIHGLIGQTWRNVDICGHAWVGDASDYVTSGLFATDSVFNYYGQNL